MARVRRAFAAACVAWVDLFDPDLIVVGGSITEHQGDRLLGPARDAIAREAFRVPARRARVVPPVLGADVSLAGAHPLVMSRLDKVATGSVRTALVGESIPA
jgi:predicted NBD/HSP70 family sugar kinase